MAAIFAILLALISALYSHAVYFMLSARIDVLKEQVDHAERAVRGVDALLDAALTRLDLYNLTMFQNHGGVTEPPKVEL